jgi:hypothetical protein
MDSFHYFINLDNSVPWYDYFANPRNQAVSQFIVLVSKFNGLLLELESSGLRKVLAHPIQTNAADPDYSTTLMFTLVPRVLLRSKPIPQLEIPHSNDTLIESNTELHNKLISDLSHSLSLLLQYDLLDRLPSIQPQPSQDITSQLRFMSSGF